MYSYDELSPYKQQDDLVRLTVTSAPTTEPVTKTEVKRHLAISESDTSQDSELDVLIQSSRRKFEEDTGTPILSTTYTQVFPVFADGLRLARKPVSAVSSITYYDSSNAQQTLATSVYAFDATTQQIRLKADQSWPDVYSRWDAVTVTFVAGYASASVVPANIKHALLALCAFYFDLDRGDNPNRVYPQTYYNLIANLTRATYP